MAGLRSQYSGGRARCCCPAPRNPAQPAVEGFAPTCRLPKRHTKEHVQREAGLDRGIAELLLATAFAALRWRRDHRRIKPPLSHILRMCCRSMIDSVPRCLRPSLQDDPLVALYCVGAQLPMSSGNRTGCHPAGPYSHSFNKASCRTAASLLPTQNTLFCIFRQSRPISSFV